MPYAFSSIQRPFYRITKLAAWPPKGITRNGIRSLFYNSLTRALVFRESTHMTEKEKQDLTGVVPEAGVALIATSTQHPAS
jgi:hypothetical protein